MRPKKYTFETSKEIALKYNTRSEFNKFDKACYSFCSRNGFLHELCKHMESTPKGFWTKEECHKEALKHESRSGFKKACSGGYIRARIDGFLDEICSHMTLKGNYYFRYVYVFEFQDNHVYVGLTYNINKRYNEHINYSNNTSVYKHIQKTNSEYKFIIITETPINSEDAQILEHKTIEKYRNNGWEILNKGKTGKGSSSLGLTPKWTKEKCAEISSKYNYISDFIENDKNAYYAARKNGWLTELCSNMINKRFTTEFTKEKCKNEALKYQHKTDFKKNSTNYYEAARRYMWLDEICSHMEFKKREPKYTKEKCQTIALNYTNKEEFKKNNSALYVAAKKKSWIKEICSHMIKKPRILKHKWTKERCHEEALKYLYKSDFREFSGTAYTISCSNKWLNEICSHMSDKVIKVTKEQCHEEALKYIYKNQFKQNNPKLYSISLRNGWINEICSHMTRKEKVSYWTKEVCHIEALKYQNKTDFRKYCSTAYNVSFRNNWLKEICSHMPQYIYWTKERCHKECLKYQHTSDLRKHNETVYKIICNNNWLKEMCSHMSRKIKEIKWTKDACKIEALNHRNRSQFKLNSKGAYTSSYRHGWLDEFFPKQPKTSPN